MRGLGPSYLGCRTFIPGVTVHDVPVYDAPSDFFILQANAFYMVHFVVGGDLYVWYAAVNASHLNVFH